jgi:hypothetical protein
MCTSGARIDIFKKKPPILIYTQAEVVFGFHVQNKKRIDKPTPGPIAVRLRA